MMNEETKASLNKFLKEREERIKNMTLAEARDIISSTYGHSDMRMESDKALQMLLDCADKTLDEQSCADKTLDRQPSFINKPCVSEGICREDKIQVLDKIRAEIIEEFDNCNICEWFEDYDYDENNISEYIFVGHISDIIDIIDKYRAESEGAE